MCTRRPRWNARGWPLPCTVRLWQRSRGFGCWFRVRSRSHRCKSHIPEPMKCYKSIVRMNCLFLNKRVQNCSNVLQGLWLKQQDACMALGSLMFRYCVSSSKITSHKPEGVEELYSTDLWQACISIQGCQPNFHRDLALQITSCAQYLRLRVWADAAVAQGKSG